MTANQTPTSGELLGCPFCGSSDISEGEVLMERPSGQCVKQNMCRECGALGPEAEVDGPDYGDVLSNAAWNTRHKPTHPEAEAMEAMAKDLEDAMHEMPGIAAENAIAMLRQQAQAVRDEAKDAARYRWIIAQDWFQFEADWRLGINAETTEDYGPAIDAAMSTQPKGGE